MEKMILVCEDSLEGIFTAIYNAYELKQNHDNIMLQVGEAQGLLFSTYKTVVSDLLKMKKVVRTIINEFGESNYYCFCQALAAEDLEKADAVYHTIVHGLKNKRKSAVMDDITNDYVNKVFCLSRNVNNEILHLKGFLRFKELENGILFSEIGPKNNIITFLAPHFSDRLSNENFMIYDSIRGIIIMHPAKKQWVITRSELLNLDEIKKYSETEQEYQDLFCYFCEKIAIEGRINKKLQRQMLPLRFREYMVEF